MGSVRVRYTSFCVRAVNPPMSAKPPPHTWRVYYSLAVWRFKPILSAGLRFHSPLLREIITLARGFRFLRVFVAVIQTELRGSEDWAVTLSYLKLLSLTKDCLLGLDQVRQGFPLCPRPCGEGWWVIWDKTRLQSFERITKTKQKNLFVRWLLNGVIETICSLKPWSLWGEIRLLS